MPPSSDDISTLLTTIALPLLCIVVVFLVFQIFRIAQEYERAVIFQLGRVTKRPRGPGLFIVIPFLERAQKIDIRVITLGIQPQDCITRDNVTVRVDAVAYFRVVDAVKAIVGVRDYMQATLQISQTTLRSVIGQFELDDLLARRDQVNDRLRTIIDEQTEQWGIKVEIVEIKDMELPDMMRRAMAKQAEAEREKRAKIIHAQGEMQAAGELKLAAQQLAESPQAMQLRYLQTLTEIAVEKNSTIIFPLPMNIMDAFMGLTKEEREENPNPPEDKST